MKRPTGFGVRLPLPTFPSSIATKRGIKANQHAIKKDRVWLQAQLNKAPRCSKRLRKRAQTVEPIRTITIRARLL